MTLHKFISRLNWRQILIHFIATWFFMYAFQTLATLHNTKLTDIVRYADNGDITKALEENKVSLSELLYFNLWPAVGNFIGLLIAFITSLIISIRKHWFWVNSLIVLVLSYLLARLELHGWPLLKIIFLTPGRVFNNTTFEFLTNGMILLALGLFTFFSGKLIQFISKPQTAH